jgi:hypothetical protein
MVGYGVGFALVELASQMSPTVPLDGPPVNSDGVQTASAQLALALLQRTNSQATPDNVIAVLNAYTKGGYLTVADQAIGGADGTVIISSEPASDKDAAKKSQSAVTLATRFSKDKPLVVAGFGASHGNLISTVRAGPTLVKDISTVDNVGIADG